jgi:serine/threonine protein kinase
MPTSEHIDELLLRWEAARQEGKDLTATDLCRDCPQLADEVRRRIHAVLAMEGVLGVNVFSPNRTRPLAGEPTTQTATDDVLPEIPGYEILRVVDEGGMGVVYQARQLDLGRTVAIKMISGVRLGPTLVARFRAEAEASARLQHPNFVQVFEVGQVSGRPYFSMEFVDGGSLADQLVRNRPDARRSAELVETLARAIHAAHDCGIVHRDLKPSNVMLSADGTPKIADFGLAKRLDELGAGSNHTQTGEVLGTPSYMAPEQAEGKRDQIGPATDVYALGAILYEMLAGQPPFRGTSPLDALRQVTSQEPVPPSRLAAAVPPDLEAICLKCLEKDRAARYTTGRDLADDLRRFLSGQPVMARRIGRFQRSWKFIRRHPQGTALVIALSLLACIPLYFVIKLHRTQREIRLKAERAAPLVREILIRNCYECHGEDPDVIRKNLNVLDHQQLLDKARPMVVPGSPADSRLIQRIADGSMPPEEEETRLPRVTEQELTILNDWVLGGAPPLPPEDPQNPTPPVVPYSPLAAEVRDIFEKHCYHCHKFDVGKGGIKILNYRLLVTVRKVVVPGRPDESELFHSLTTKNEDLRMPPITEERLPAKAINTIRRWIEEGAPPFPKKE